MPDLLPFEEITPADADRMGGKARSLAELTRAGLPVPPGFCLTADAYRRLYPRGLDTEQPLRQAILDQYQRLGCGPVAVRSSATFEDSAGASFAGQQETVLGVEGAGALCDAIERCWRSLHGERAVAYRRKLGTPGETPAMAVVVQRMVPAEVAGVLFTRDPLDETGRRMLVEAARGLGEAVVSGRAEPDRFHIDRDSGEILERHPGREQTRRTPHGEEEVPPERRGAFCLSPGQLAELAALGRRVEQLCGAPRDIEWAFADGKFWLLQARPITAAGAFEREQVRREEVGHARAKADPGGTVWVRLNLAEVLPEPTPMTWSVVRHLLSGGGAMGRMYRDFGASPDPAVGAETAFDLIAGRPYCNLSRMPRLQFRHPPAEYPFAAYREDPRRALDPRPVLNPLRGGVMAWFRLPATVWQLVRIQRRLHRAARTFADHFRAEVIPAFVAETEAAAARDLSALRPPELVEALHREIRRTLVEFGRESLKPTVLADFAWDALREVLRRRLGEERLAGALVELSRGARPDPGADLPAALADLRAGRLDGDEFLRRFGHRGEQEMELSRPRWAEQPHGPERLAGRCPVPEAGGNLPMAGDPDGAWERIADEAKLTAFLRGALAERVRWLRTYLGLRETAKHYLMLGYAQIRRTLVELDRRFGLSGGIFFLTLEDLPRLLKGEDVATTIAERRRRRSIALSLEVPPVLFSDDLDAIGRPAPAPTEGEHFQGVPLSAGVAEGPALVLTHPGEADPPAGPYVLVCPSTDPAWVPLFLSAKALVMETGGVLSHGAIVAREFGLPAVAGLPGVVRRLRSGQRLRVDGGRGRVTVSG